MRYSPQQIAVQCCLLRRPGRSVSRSRSPWLSLALTGTPTSDAGIPISAVCCTTITRLAGSDTTANPTSIAENTRPTVVNSSQRLKVKFDYRRMTVTRLGSVSVQ